MSTRTDIEETALRMVEKHGPNAEEIALGAMQKSMRRDDLVAASAWLAISSAIHELVTDRPRGKPH